MSKRPRRDRRPAGRAARPSAPSDQPFSGPETQGEPASPAEPSEGGRRSTALSRATTTRPAGRSTRASRARRVDDRNFFDRYRGALLALFALAGVGIIGFVVLQQSASAAGYTCASLMTPGPEASVSTAAPTFRPTPTAVSSSSAAPSGSVSPSDSSVASGSPAPSASAVPSGSAVPSASPPASASASPSASLTPGPSPTALAGFPATDLGNTHVPPGSSVEYAYCPPTSGSHYNALGQGPISREFYGPDSVVRPGGWVHNLEHGYIVVAYRGGPEGATTEELAQIRTFFETAPASTYPGSCPSVPNKVLVVRFDSMTTRFGILAWDRALLTDAWDADEALAFYQQWVDSPQTPERGSC